MYLSNESLQCADLRRRTSPNLKDHSKLGKTEEILKSVLSHINEDKRKMEGKMKMFDIVHNVRLSNLLQR